MGITREEEDSIRYRDLIDVYNSCAFALTTVDSTLFKEETKCEGRNHT